jgi:hypothetical protein
MTMKERLGASLVRSRPQTQRRDIQRVSTTFFHPANRPIDFVKPFLFGFFINSVRVRVRVRVEVRVRVGVGFGLVT